ncbi:hypothetical protein PD5205_01660 [Xanthomonas fragariae]|uniref:Uncharacterized protein n=1 Tax=Xanthomonas fragariae TaxID=48664 RepID=A0A1Y6HC08_9XANT|nr:hypothetical protein NBC2815_01668 [Xanthomonas fragariae]SMQ98923.1 hypothetical protein PD885_01678 [Xanthomonas fragariae]SMR02964.1 hypothetical protein PD5205_01660 [Xanthomonas fragariae]
MQFPGKRNARPNVTPYMGARARFKQNDHADKTIMPIDPGYRVPGGSIAAPSTCAAVSTSGITRS